MDKNNASKKIKKADLSVTILLIIGILAVVNFFSYQLFLRVDLTQNKVYSISKASKRAVGELDDIVNIKAYFSDELPSQVLSIKQEVGDILDEYATFSNGKVRVEFIDPSGDETVERELAMIGIPQLTFEVYEKDKMQLVNGYMGIAVSHSGNTEVIPAVKQNTSDLEYQLTTAIKKVVVDEIATVGFVVSHGTVSIENDIKAASDELAKLYTVRQVTLDEENPEVAADIDTLVIAGPKENFNEEALKALNTFLKRGGSLLVFLDGVKIEEGLMASKNETNLDTLLSKYGVTINKDLLADTQSGVASFSQGFMTFSSKYPFWPEVRQDGFDTDNSSVANLENVLFPWASSISVDENKISPENISLLAQTTQYAWIVKDNFNINPQNTAAPQGDRKRYPLAVSVKSGLKDAYPEEGAEASEITGRLIAVGDSDFINNGFIRNNPDNLTLFQNLVDSLSFDEDLINIRSKGVTSRPIKEDLTDASKAAIRYANVLLVTIAVIIFGMLRYFMRRRSRFIDDL